MPRFRAPEDVVRKPAAEVGRVYTGASGARREVTASTPDEVTFRVVGLPEPDTGSRRGNCLPVGTTKTITASGWRRWLTTNAPRP